MQNERNTRREAKQRTQTIQSLSIAAVEFRLLMKLASGFFSLYQIYVTVTADVCLVYTLSGGVHVVLYKN